MGLHFPLLLQPQYHSLSGKVLHTLSKSRFLHNETEHENRLLAISACAIKILIITPLLTGCAVLDVLWWCCKTITVYPVYTSGIKSHTYDLFTFLTIPITTLIYAILNCIPPSPLPLALGETWPPLHLAVFNNDLDAVKKLIANGANPNEKIIVFYHIRSATPLDLAVEKGFEEIVKYLLSLESINVNTTHNSSYSTLQVALHQLRSAANLQQTEKYIRIIKLLIQKGADPNHTYSLGAFVRTPLLFFLDRISPKTPEFDVIVEEMLKKGGELNTYTHPGTALYAGGIRGVISPLSNAVAALPKSTVELLLKYGAEVHNSSSFHPPIKSAFVYKRDDLLPLLIQAMQEQGAARKVDLINTRHPKIGTMPIVHALMNAHEGGVEMLQKAGARLDVALDEGLLDVIKLIKEVRSMWNGCSNDADKTLADKNVKALVNKTIECPKDHDTHPNMFFNAIRYDVTKLFKQQSELPKLDAIEKLLLKERTKDRVNLLKQTFDAFSADLNMPKELIAMIAEY